MNTPFHPVQPAGRRFWQAHIEALAESGFSRSEYCRRHHLSYHALTYWVRKQRRLVKPTSLHTLVEVPADHLLPIRRAEAVFRLHLGSGRMLEIAFHVTFSRESGTPTIGYPGVSQGPLIIQLWSCPTWI